MKALGAFNKQATLDPFFDISIGQGNYAPRRRTAANVSKRLMGVIKQFREAEARVNGQKPEGWDVMMCGLDEEDPKGRGTGKRRKSGTVEKPENAEEDGETIPSKKRKASTTGRLKRAPSSASRSEIGSESVGSSTGPGEEFSHGEKSRRTSSRGRVRGTGRGRALPRT